MKTRRLNYLDMAKGIGIILVVIGHSGIASNKLVTWISSFHMPLFMIISGMILYHNNEIEQSFLHSMKKKSRSILVPYAFFSVIYLPINLYYATTGRDVQPVNAILQAISFFGISVLWFLPALFIGEMFFLFLRKHASCIVTAVCCIFFCPVIFLLKWLYEQYYTSGNSLFFLWLGYLIVALIRGGIAFLFITIGYYIMCLWEKFESSGEFSHIWYFGFAMAFTLVNFGIVGINGRTDFRYMTFNNPFLYFGGALSGSMAVVCLCKALPSIRLLNFLGINSLIIMVTHLDCFVLNISIKFSHFMNQLIPFEKWHMLWLCIAIVFLLIETIIIYIINHFFPILLGQCIQKK